MDAEPPIASFLKSMLIGGGPVNASVIVTKNLIPMLTTDWQQKFSQILANTLHAFCPALTDDALVMLAIDCHPWDGGLCFAALTQSEVDADSSLADPSEMAAWKYYDFAESLSEFNVELLCLTMKSDYYATDDHCSIVRAYLRACAAALTDDRVRAALQSYNLQDGFRVSVTDPDDQTEYCN